MALAPALIVVTLPAVARGKDKVGNWEVGTARAVAATNR